MKLHDITLTVSEAMTVWPGDPPVSLKRVLSIAAGDPCNVTMLRLGAHTGTHIDAPCHYIEGGGGVDGIRPEALIGPCLVVEPGVDRGLIEAGHLERLGLDGHTRLLFKTGNSLMRPAAGEDFREDFAALGLSAARFLAERKVALVGIDYLSVESYRADRGHPVHRILLENNIVILEGLDLSSISPGPYELICLPLKLAGADGAPARVFLKQDD